MNREQWLRTAAERLDLAVLAPQGARLPEHWAISVRFPRGSRKAIGQAWPAGTAADGKTHHILISPILGNEDIVNLLQVVLHECIHVAVGNKHGHGGEFKRVARAVGLEGKLTATTVSEGSVLYKQLEALAKELGPYEHVTLVPRARMRGGETPRVPDGGDEGGGEEAPKKQRGWVRYQSTREPKYTVVVSPKSVEEWGAPRDPWGIEMEVKE